MEPAQIVLIEDNPADVLLVQLSLEENGIPHALRAFTSGAEAVRQLCGPDADDFAPDAILMDLNTPGSDGFEVLKRLQQQFAMVPITILTSSRAQADKRRASQMKVRYLEKASELKMFLETVGEAVKEMLAHDGDGQVSSAVAPQISRT
jgi:CheY-like chemotaxis protein